MALRGAAGEIGGALALAAASTALGFYAFGPTNYRGVSELGVIAGTGTALAPAGSASDATAATRITTRGAIGLWRTSLAAPGLRRIGWRPTAWRST